ncbi:hypothetical protein LMJ53_13485 [Rheinheimera sp. UJ51]|uniref:hypothetical protein n=1 Tax=Rheinheimera sp. UJ51 TaxID=2892446 RepID=UPI001E3FC167|nr:hypothetical protein [Rheinheimera sp. UJ51]MCC5452734.1 hypothetical protein [Rheinheimera sp. UJ51]
MNNLSTKQWLWILLVVVPLTFYVVEFFIDDQPFGILSFSRCIASSILGVLLAYFIFTKALIKLQAISGYRFIALFIIVLLLVGLASLINITGLNHLGILMSKVFVLSFNSSAIVLVLGHKRQAEH